MKKVYWEILISIVFVLGSAFLLYGQLESKTAFWDAQSIWSVALIIGWSVYSIEYFRQGWILHHAHTSANISVLLPTTYIVMQCILFVKGVFFRDWSLIASALIVNSGVVFYLYQIIKLKSRRARSK
jgi:hypothetical protein